MSDLQPFLLSVLGAPSEGGSPWGTAIVALFFFVIVAIVGSSMASAKDRAWLPIVIMAGFIAKLIGSTARFLVLELVYGGKGDASGYHGAGLALSEVWRSFQVPTTQRIGTDVVDAITGLLYLPYQPSKLGGFYIFASLAFFGQLLLYAAFRHALPARHLKWYAAAIFFWPTIVYWPSSIGKESVMILWIGVASYGIARLLSGYNPAWVGLIGIGLGGAGLIRLHVALLLAGGLFFALVAARAPKIRAAQSKRFLFVVAGAVGLAAAIALTASNFGVNLAAAASVEAATDEVGSVFESVEAQTNTGGSAVSGGTVSNPLDLPEAFLRVMFRPLPNEASNLQLLASSLEGAVLLLVTVIRLPWILRNLARIRQFPYLVFSLAYTGGFVIAFSSILNLGILARQRSQAIPFYLALLIVLGRRHVDQEPEIDTAEVSAPARPMALAHH